MKRGTIEHPKFLALMAELGCEDYELVGRLEMLWHFTAKFAPAGNLGKWPDGAIAQACRWRDDPAAFVAALVSTGWLDEHPDHRLVVHDWHAHADNAIHGSLARARERFACGRAPKLYGLSKEERPAAKAHYESTDSQSGALSGGLSGGPSGDASGGHRIGKSVAKPSQAKPTHTARAREDRPSPPSRDVQLAALWRDHLVAHDPHADASDDGWWETAGEAQAVRAFGQAPNRWTFDELAEVLRWAFDDQGDGKWKGWANTLTHPAKFASKLADIRASMRARTTPPEKPPDEPPPYYRRLDPKRFDEASGP